MLAAPEIFSSFLAQVLTQLTWLQTSWSDSEPVEGKLLWERLAAILFQQMPWTFDVSPAW